MESLQKRRRLLKLNLQRCKEAMHSIINRKEIDFEGISRLESLLEEEYRPLKEDFRKLLFELNDQVDEATEEGFKLTEQLLKETDDCRDTSAYVSSKIKHFRKNINKEVSRQSLLSAPDPGQSAGSKSNDSQPKLKRINVPTFDGNLQQFYNFRSLFENLVHNNEDLSNVQRLYYLKEALIGPAHAIVKDCELADAAYPEAWSDFLSRYDNRRAIIRDYFRELKNITPIKSELQIRSVIDSVNSIIRGLKAAGEPVEGTFSKYVAYHISSILDPITARDWENSLNTCSSFPTFGELNKFLQARTFVVEERNKDVGSQLPIKEGRKSGAEKKTFLVTKLACVVCRAEHRLVDCKQFLCLSPRDRFNTVKKNSLCLNCFNRNHTSSQCTRSGCKACNRKHHSLLHFEAKPAVTALPAAPNAPLTASGTSSSAQPTPPADNASSLSCYEAPNSKSFILLPTAVVNFGCNSIHGTTRILLDNCSQRTLFSDAFIRRFRLPTYQSDSGPITGIGGGVSPSFDAAIRLFSRYEDFELRVEGNVVPQSALSYNVHQLSTGSLWPQIKNLELADPAFQNSFVDILNIDMIVGAAFYERCVMDELKIIEGTFLRRSHFGWLLAGPVNQPQTSNFVGTTSNLVCGHATQEVDSILERFWKVEEIPIEKPCLSVEEEECNRHFESTYRRDPETGQFIVRLPFNESRDSLINNFSRALASFSRIEKMLNSAAEEIKSLYVDFMREYQELNHMSLVSLDDKTEIAYYCPHRAVIRPDSETTKLRVVFNASAKTRSGLSLNDTLMKGPLLQQELFDSLLEFRRHVVAFMADIAKMYRCIEVDPADRRFQRIVWRENSSEPLREFELNTLTYGTKSASFIATKCLAVIAEELRRSNPSSLAADFISKGFYMDDLLAGADTLTAALELQHEIHTALAAAKFPLRKYKSNSSEFLRNISRLNMGDASCSAFNFSENSSVLGLVWEPTTDTFAVRVSTRVLGDVLTKRIILSELSRVFDPLGFLSPVTIRAKIIMQLIWKEKLDWDTPLPESLSRLCYSYLSEIPQLSQVQINRRYSSIVSSASDQLIGFCDASQSAYCAVIYFRRLSTNNPAEVESYIVCSKTRVAPVRTLTVPKLELQAAFLLASLLDRVAAKLGVDPSSVFAFSDSTVVLDWLRKSPAELKVFESNRVSKIQSMVCSHWAHVGTRDNPADQATRGIAASALSSSELWFFGPSHLSSSDFILPESSIFPSVESSCLIANSDRNVKPSLFVDKFSSYRKLVNTVAYIFRWKRLALDRDNPVVKSISFVEFTRAHFVVVRVVQMSFFLADINLLQENQPVRKQSSLAKLDPFLDQHGVMRVGGRLEKSSFSSDKRHPVILPAKSHFSLILISHLHTKYFHAGRKFLESYLSSQYWIIGGRTNLIKKVLRTCIHCRRICAKVRHQLMGQLPEPRVSITRPFKYTGVDLGGHFDCKCVGHRTTRKYKIYLALFVCLVTRAVHLEIVSNLSAHGFIECLQRFISRRGIPVQMHSDNATNFVGASNFFIDNQEEFTSFATSENFAWHFIPPSTPHHGGMWEAGIKSAKKFLLNATKGSVLTFEQYATFFARVEAVMNSRPLCYSQNIGQAAEVLTPAHFLIGETFSAIPAVEANDIPLPQRFRLIRDQLQSFWRCWSKDYINQLQCRHKWKQPQPNLAVGQIVLVKEPSAGHPLNWPLGLITEVYPGTDGLVRVADVRMRNKIFRRSICKLITLPIES